MARNLFEEAAKRVALKKKLFKHLLGVLIDVDYSGLSKTDVLKIADGAIASFKKNF